MQNGGDCQENRKKKRRSGANRSRPSLFMWLTMSCDLRQSRRCASARPACPSGHDVQILSDARLAIAPIDTRETGLWAIDLTYKER